MNDIMNDIKIDTPTIEEYQNAKKIVENFENKTKHLENIQLEKFKNDLTFLFLNNNKLIIKEFKIEKGLLNYDIIPIDPDLDEMYEGELNNDIELLCNKYNIKASIVYWCYHK